MANTNLTSDTITSETLRILHQKLQFITRIHRGYDKSFANNEAKIGSTLRIRLPNKFAVRKGATLAAQDVISQETSITVKQQIGVDMNFSSKELTLDIDRFSERYIEPAALVLAANMEVDALKMHLEVWNSIYNGNQAITSEKVLYMKKYLDDNLAPPGENRTLLVNTQDEIDIVESLKGLFQSGAQISKQYETGRMGRALGFDWYSSSLMPKHMSGSFDSGYLVNGTVATQGATSVVVDGGTGTIDKGAVFTIASSGTVQAETGILTGGTRQLVVTRDFAGGAGTLHFSPALYSTGTSKNVSKLPGDNKAISIQSAREKNNKVSLGFHRDAFAFATADMVMPGGVDMKSRKNYDGISMRLVRQYDINSDNFPCRLDILYGHKAIRPELAVRIHSN